MKKKIGLVIQGALMSIGRSGGKLHESPDQLRQKGGVVNFDCRENIKKIINTYGHLFDEIVVSVFDNQLEPEDHFPGAKIVSGPDPGGVKQVGHYKDNNKARQFLSTLNGLKELEKSGIEYTIKARTDQYFNYDKLIKSFLLGIEKVSNPETIFVTVMHPPTYLLHDLYFAASTRALKKFCEAILAYDQFEFISSVHRDMVLKHAYVEYKDVIKVPEWAYFPFSPPNGVNSETRKIFDYMFNNVYVPIDPDVFRSTLWRGEYYEEDHVSRLIKGQNQKPRNLNIPAFISIDWRRYFAFRRQQYGEKARALNKVTEVIGLVGWKFWNLIRTLVNSFRK
ncbi:MAG TPA: hypothetical protein VJC12_03505 [Candidatus Paceibacterota bacterium]